MWRWFLLLLAIYNQKRLRLFWSFARLKLTNYLLPVAHLSSNRQYLIIPYQFSGKRYELLVPYYPQCTMDGPVVYQGVVPSELHRHNPALPLLVTPRQLGIAKLTISWLEADSIRTVSEDEMVGQLRLKEN